MKKNMRIYWLTGSLVAVSIGMGLGYASGQSEDTVAADANRKTPNIRKRVTGDADSEDRQPPIFKSHSLLGSDPTTAMDVLQSTFAGRDNMKLALDPKTNRLLVQAAISEHDSIDKILREIAGLNNDSPVETSVSAKLDHQNKKEESVRRMVAELLQAESKASEEEKAVKRKALTDATRDQLIEMEAHRKAQVEALEKRVARLKQVLDLRSKNLETIVENRVKSLLGEGSELDWAWQLSDGPQLSLLSDDSFRFAVDKARLKKNVDLLALSQGLASIDLDDKSAAIRKLAAEKLALVKEAESLAHAESLSSQKKDASSSQRSEEKLRFEALARRIEELTREIEVKSKLINDLESKLVPLSNEIQRLQGVQTK